MPDLAPCKHVFSNGTEYIWFLEHNCGQCTRFRNGRCRIYNRIELARIDEKYFPYDDLMEYPGYAGKKCKQFTTEKLIRKRKQISGQIQMEV